MVRNDFEVKVQIVVHALEEKFEYGDAGADLEIKGPINKFEISRAAPMKIIHRLEKARQLERFCGLVQRRQAEFALERATARCLDINQPIAQVFIAVIRIGQLQLIQLDGLAGDHLCCDRPPSQQIIAKFAKTGFARPGDDEISLLDKFGQVVGKTDFRPANNHPRLRRDLLQHFDHLRGFGDVPDVDAEPYDFRL